MAKQYRFRCELCDTKTGWHSTEDLAESEHMGHHAGTHEPARRHASVQSLSRGAKSPWVPERYPYIEPRPSDMKFGSVEHERWQELQRTEESRRMQLREAL